jgi:hypothetical protein
VRDEANSDDSEPTPERQAELRAACDANVTAGKAPYEGVHIRTRGELSWIMHERDWSGEPRAGGKDRANLTGADLSQGGHGRWILPNHACALLKRRA